ncbi:MAG: thioredoxin domain-containing protein [Candidatus Parcubacteria bacterium]|nr:thioredoxin domain-containing protein [Candidatus Parcubacteria bacterium]
MQKIKFQIKGMHCHSCAILIEDKLQEQPGVISAKVNDETYKVVVAYDENKITKNDIFQAVNSAGDYSAQEIDEADGAQTKISSQPDLSAKKSFAYGLGVSLVSFSIIGLIIWGALSQNSSSSASSEKTVLPPTNPVAQPSQNAPAPTAPDKNTIQTFNITKDDNVRGNFNAPITLVEYSDFECPYCGKIYPTFKDILSKYEGKVRLVYKYFPLSFHPNAQKAAEAAACAAEQGKFWQYHDKLFDNQSSGFSLDKFKTWAIDLGLNAKQFNNCLDTDKYADKVNAEEQEGQSKGVKGTPATFINGQLVSGALPYDSFAQIIDSILK